MEVAALRPGLWRWTARHPAWRDGADWGPDVGCVYFEAAEAVVLVDPQVPDGKDEARFWRALERDVARVALPVAVVLTAPWHRRSADTIVARYDASVWSAADADAGLPAGLEAYPIPPREEAQVALFLPEHRALVTAEILTGTPGGLAVLPSPQLADHDQLRLALERLAALDVEIVLPAHGPPVLAGGADAIATALRRSAS